MTSMKIEGRMKNALYVAVVTRTYRKAIDDCLKDKNLYETNRDWYRQEMEACTHRQYGTGFFYGKRTRRDRSTAAAPIRKTTFIWGWQRRSRRTDTAEWSRRTSSPWGRPLRL